MTGLNDPRVAIVELPGASYDSGASRALDEALEKIAKLLEWRASDSTVMLDRCVPTGARVVVKPNWVSHQNQGPWGMEPLVTHSAVIHCLVRHLLETQAGEVLVGDAPLQLCDFAQLLQATGVDEWADQLRGLEPRFRGLQDFRRTTCEVRDGQRVAFEDRVPEEQFVRFDLGSDSLLEPITDGRGRFRVTQYNPTHMIRTHGPGRHQYLVARPLIEADVVVNVPKLKTHKKAGVTCALKNLIGINGNKEFLPHHRVGGSESGGDCYPGRSRIKRALEYALDQMNLAESSPARRMWHEVARFLERAARLTGDRLGVEGSWSGNDTIWRTCLDLNKILLYGNPDSSMAERPQREVIHVVDAIIAGHGDGPLAPQPLPLCLLVAGRNAAAVDWVGALLLGYEPLRIPIVREAFHTTRWPMVQFTPDRVQVLGDLGTGEARMVLKDFSPPVSLTYPPGWHSAVAPSGAPVGALPEGGS